MRKLLSLLAAAAFFAGAAEAADYFNHPGKWKSLGRGEHSVGYDEATQALVFSSKQDVEPCFYPIHGIPAKMAEKLHSLRFEWKLANPENKLTKFQVVLAKQGDHNGRFDIPITDGKEFRQVTVDLTAGNYPVKKAWGFQILAGSQSRECRMLVRKIELLDGQGNVIAPPQFKVPAKTSTMLTPGSILQMYPEPGKEWDYSFSANGKLPAEFSGTLTDYDGGAAGDVTFRRSGENLYGFRTALPRGFYELAVPATNQKFGILALEPFDGKYDPLFSLEPLLIHRECDEKTMGEVLDMIKRFGIISLREYHSFPGETPDLALKPWKNRFYQLAAERGMKGCYFYGNPAGWVASDFCLDAGSPKYQPYPTRLLRNGEATAATLKQWRKGLDAYQAWNEPDMLPVPPDQYASLLAAESVSVAESFPGLDVVHCGIAGLQGGHAASYITPAALDFCDIFAFHDYGKPETFGHTIRFFRDRMASSPKANMPVWITECGRPWKRNFISKDTYGGPVGDLRPLPADGRQSSSGITVKALEAKAYGIERFFVFALKFFPENQNNFGLTDPMWTPLHPLAGYFNAVRELSNYHYAGDLAQLPDGVKFCRVFSDGKAFKAVPYTGSDELLTLDVGTLPLTAQRSPDGRPAALKDGKARVRGYAYWDIDPARAESVLKRDTEPMKYWKSAQDYQKIPRRSSPAVYQFHHWNPPLPKDRFFYCALPENPEFELFNFSRQPLTAEPELELPAGVKIVAAPGKVTLAPRTSKTLHWKLDWAGSGGGKVILRDRANGSMPLELNFLDLSRAGGRSFDFANPERWDRNSAAELTVAGDEKEKTLHFSVDFSKVKDHWVYPGYTFNPEESLKGAVGIAFDIKARQSGDFNVQRFTTVAVMVNFGNSREYEFTRFPAPAEEWSSRKVAFPPTWDMEKVSRIRIGMNPYSPKLEYSLRNIRILYAPAK